MKKLALLVVSLLVNSFCPGQRGPIEEDWRRQDGIRTPREAVSWETAIRRTLARGDALIRDLSRADVKLDDLLPAWEACRHRLRELASTVDGEEQSQEALWRRVHRLRRRIVFRNPLARTGPILFARQKPGKFSHQLTQYYGRFSLPGGGLFVLEAPGDSLRCRDLTGTLLPPGSFQQPEVSPDGERILFAYCRAAGPGEGRREGGGPYYDLYEMAADGADVRQLTDGPWDDFSPRYLPDGRIVFVSTRRGGFHRCGALACPVYTLAVIDEPRVKPRVISWHETQEWDPAVLHDGRIIYTRWDYVDRSAVYYQQLWSVRPDGTDSRIFYGNNTFNPVGIWEARPVPGSHRVMATAAAHHAMTAGSIILVDPVRGVDGPEAITRLTPDVLFPESEIPVGHWHAPAGVPEPPPVPTEQRRWPGHSYRSPWPLSERYFLAAYGYEELIGEPHANPANLFGIYLVDVFGNKELLHRDPEIASLWPVPLGPRVAAPSLPSVLQKVADPTGTYFVQDVSESWPELLPDNSQRIRALRILQVLPKSTPHVNQPRVGLANASPGKQVLGTVPVEKDGSAYFRVPSGIPLSFQALDAQGRAVQIMRSLTYLQPGESAGCIGCHEHRTRAPASRSSPLALKRAPSEIEPGPDGSRPFSYPLLVQPVLDKHCVTCHQGKDAPKGILLTGEPRGEFSASYQALAPRVPRSEWRSGPGFPVENSEPLTRPGFFGAIASPLLKMLLEGHQKVRLDPGELERLVTWMDTNALFYGTFDPEDQARQLRGERIAGPAVE